MSFEGLYLGLSHKSLWFCMSWGRPLQLWFWPRKYSYPPPRDAAGHLPNTFFTEKTFFFPPPRPIVFGMCCKQRKMVCFTWWFFTCVVLFFQFFGCFIFNNYWIFLPYGEKSLHFKWTTLGFGLGCRRLGTLAIIPSSSMVGCRLSQRFRTGKLHKRLEDVWFQCFYIEGLLKSKMMENSLSNFFC